MTTHLDGTDDVFDSRDLIERIEELTAEFIEATDSEPADIMSTDDWLLGLSEDDAEKLTALVALRDELGESDARDGITLIRDGYFPEYAEEFVTECGYIPEELPSWIANHIDWEAVADEIRVDYSASELFGETYWWRY